DKWTNKKKFKKFDIEREQFYFKKDLLKVVEKSSLSDINNKNNLNSEGFPSIWIATEILMFGNLIHLIKLMSRANQVKLAKFYNCSTKELISWLKCLNFARNICAHNANIIDIELQTKPIIRKEWINKYLITTINSNGLVEPTFKIAVIVLITISLVKEINCKYKWKPIRSNLAGICKDSDVSKANINANIIGFANSTTALDLTSFAKGNF
ncbi:TPA: Abi family protein, partial [Streptococcus suis]|nr:Abi family protein [Streptococcus suis]